MTEKVTEEESFRKSKKFWVEFSVEKVIRKRSLQNVNFTEEDDLRVFFKGMETIP